MLRIRKKQWEPCEAFFLTQIRDAEYRFSGKVKHVYAIHNNRRIVVIDTGHYIFYFEEADDEMHHATGDFISGCGQLCIDHNLYFETLDQIDVPFADYFAPHQKKVMLQYCLADRSAETVPPAVSLVYEMQVLDIIKVNIPSELIQRKQDALTYPASLPAGSYGPEHMCLLTDMAENTGGPCFYILQLTGGHLQ